MRYRAILDFVPRMDASPQIIGVAHAEGMGTGPTEGRRPGPPEGKGPVIEGEFERLDERPEPRRRRNGHALD